MPYDDDESRRATNSRRPPGTFAGLSPEKFFLASSTNSSSNINNNNNNNVNFINKIKNFSFWPPQSKKRRRNKYNNNSSIINNSDDSKVDEQRERESSLSEQNGKKTYRHYELFIAKLENSQIFENKRNFFRLLEDIRAGNEDYDHRENRAPQIWSQKIDTGLVNHLSKKFADAALPTNKVAVVEEKRQLLVNKDDETLFYLRFKREKSEPKDIRVSEERDRKSKNNRLSWATSYSLDTGRDLGPAPDAFHNNNLALIGGAPTCVWRLAKKFESGDMDQVGPLKLYQTQVHKRELEKICVHNQGSVHQKACIFEDGTPRSKESETPEDDQSAPARRQESFMRAVLHLDAEHHRITDENLRELDRRTTRRVSYIKATNMTVSCATAAQSTKTQGRKTMSSSSSVVADPNDESSNFKLLDEEKNTREENRKIMSLSISDDQPINRKSFDLSKNDEFDKRVHRLSTISSSTCLYDSLSSITAVAGIDASTSATETLTPASTTTSWSSERRQKKRHHDLRLSSGANEPFSSPPSSCNFWDRRRNLAEDGCSGGSGEKVGDKFMSTSNHHQQHSSHQQAPLSAGLIRQMPGGVQKIFNFFTGGETSQQQNLFTSNKEEEKFLDPETGGGRRRRPFCNPSPSTSRDVFSASDVENATAGAGLNDNNKILKANSTLNISASTAGSTSCLSAASSSGGGNAGLSPGGGGRFRSQPQQQTWRQKRNVCLPCAGLLRDGSLTHKRVTATSASSSTSNYQGRPRRFNEKVWRHYWAVLHNSKIYLCKQKPTLDTNDSMIVMSDVCDENVIDVEGCIADIAYDYHKRKNVFRLTTQNQDEHLFQAEEPESMLQWLKAVQCCSSLDDNLNNSMALIVKRYEAAQSQQSVSPSSTSSRLRRPAFMNINVGVAPSSSKKSSYAADGNENLQHPLHGKVKECVSDSSGQSQTATAAAAAATKNNIHAVVAQRESSSLQSVLSAHAERFDKKEKGEIGISVKSRKWRKVRKSGSCPSGPNARGGANSGDCMLGQQIEECVTSGDNDYIPLIVRLCVKVVEHYGLNTIGVYRIPGNTTAVNALISSLDKGFENTDFNDPRWRDVNVVSSLLKAFLRRLPDPLLTDRFYLEFIQANRIDDNSTRLRKLKETIHKLPRANYETTKYLMFHLMRIVQHSEINKMEAKNLALMFAPSIVRPGSDSMATMVSHMSDQCKIIESLILYCDWLFSGPETSPGDRTPPLTPVFFDSVEKHDLYSPPGMSELLSRMVKTEEDLIHAKHSITKNILKIRRNSRKSSTKIVGGKFPTTSNRKNVDDNDAEEEEDDDEEEENIRQDDSETENEQEVEEQELFNYVENSTTTTTPFEKNSKNLQRRKSSKKRGQNDYNERNIDAEIENRRQENLDVKDFRSEAEELRRLREEQLYTARRIFITGPPPDVESSTAMPDVFSPTDSASYRRQAENLHSLNINSLNSSLDVLSPETREKIRQFQNESRKFSSTLKVYNLSNNKTNNNSKNCTSSTNLNMNTTTNMNSEPAGVFLTPESASVRCSSRQNMILMSQSTTLIAPNQPNTSDYSSANDSPVSGYILNNNNGGGRESEKKFRSAAPLTETPEQQTQTADSALRYLNNLSISISTPAVVADSTNYKTSQNDEIRRQKNQSCESCTSFSVSPSTTSHSREWSSPIGGPSSSTLAEKCAIEEEEDKAQKNSQTQKLTFLSSKIGQKMKFRSRSASNLKRKEIRRHTLSNARDVENMIEKALEKNRAAAENADPNVKKRSGGGGKFRFWFGKE